MNLGCAFYSTNVSFFSFSSVGLFFFAIVIAGAGEHWCFYITASPFINDDSI